MQCWNQEHTASVDLDAWCRLRARSAIVDSINSVAGEHVAQASAWWNKGSAISVGAGSFTSPIRGNIQLIDPLP